jgi:hypothetical protein
MEQRLESRWLCAGLLALLVFFSLYLSLNRIYQVDEAQNTYMAMIIGTGQTGSYVTNAPLWLIGPLAWLAGSVTHSSTLFEWNRIIFFGVFWLNIILIALNTGERLLSRKGLTLLLLAATLAPLWDYGFEIRHDNLILTGLLLMWWLGRTRPRGVPSYLLLGCLTVLIQFVAFKAFVYVLPLSLAFLACPPPAHNRRRLGLATAWAAGALVAFLVCRLTYGLSGLWPVYLAGFQGGVEASGGGTRFGPWMALGRPLAQTPLLLALAAAAFWDLTLSVRKKGWSAWNWSGHAPEGCLCLGALGALFINPTPFPYNLVNLIPFIFLLAVRFLAPFMEGLTANPKQLALAGGILLFTHAMPFAAATWRHVDWSNDRQENLMRTAESLTDPAKDPVYDAIGMVPTRRSIHFNWYLHSLNMQSMLEGKVPSVAQMLSTQPAPVLIPSYRTDWLPKDDWTFIQSRYLPLSDDLWVLGQILPAGGGRYLVVHPGRYQILGRQGTQFRSIPSGLLDGHPLEEKITKLGLGPHELRCQPDIQPVVVWIGPRAEGLPEIGPGNHLRLFVNWY